MNLPDNLPQQLIHLAHSYDVSRLILFGSRARGDNHLRSDIDLAVYGLTASEVGCFRLDLEELPTLLQFDVVGIDEDTSPALLKEIQQDGVVLYDDQTTKLL